MRSNRNCLAALIAAVVVMLGLVSAPAGATEDTEPLSVTTLPTLDPDAEPGVPPENLLEDGNVEGVFDEDGNLEGYFDEEGNYIPLDYAAPSESEMLASCPNYAQGDYVHYSGGDASGHGWWVTDSTCKYKYSKIYVALYEYYTDQSWRRKAYAGPLYKRPKNYFTSDRVTARRKCDRTLASGWKSFVSSTYSETNYSWKWTKEVVVGCRIY